MKLRFMSLLASKILWMTEGSRFHTFDDINAKYDVEILFSGLIKMNFDVNFFRIIYNTKEIDADLWAKRDLNP